MNILVSACLLGINCKYNGENNLQEILKEKVGDYNFIPVCPEQLGGLGTPRQPSERLGDKILSKCGKDVTDNFTRGANEALDIAKLYGCKYAILKEKSPSCGYGQIYDGTFTGRLTYGNGVTSELLEKNNIKIIGESKLKDFLKERGNNYEEI